MVGWFDFAAEAVPSCEQQTGRYLSVSQNHQTSQEAILLLLPDFAFLLVPSWEDPVATFYLSSLQPA